MSQDTATPTFEEIRAKINFYTAVDDNRSRIIYDAVKDTRDILGWMVEVGVYKGGSAKLIAVTSPDKPLLAFDTFEGLPTPSDKDEGTVHKTGDFSDANFRVVKETLKDCHNVILHRGLFPGDYQAYSVFGSPISFAHIDVDLYEGTKESLAFIYPNMVTGGIFVVDDYGWKDTPGVKMAVDEFFSDKLEKVIDTGFGSCKVVKL